MFGGPLGISFAPTIRKSPYWTRVLTPIAKWYAEVSGYRRMGLKYDDLLIEEREDVQKAISRLPKREAYDRVYRMRVGMQSSLVHKDLPKEQWIKPEEDIRYLTPYVEEVAREDTERKYWDTIQITDKKH